MFRKNPCKMLRTRRKVHKPGLASIPDKCVLTVLLVPDECGFFPSCGRDGDR